MENGCCLYGRMKTVSGTAVPGLIPSRFGCLGVVLEAVTRGAVVQGSDKQTTHRGMYYDCRTLGLFVRARFRQRHLAMRRCVVV